MIFFVLVLLLITASSAEVASANTFHRDYLSRTTSNVIKGIFVILILFSHGKSYIKLGGVYDDAYTAMQNHLNQMVVAMFFFYSGYGMMEQIKNRGFSYVKTIAAKRFPKLLISFDFAVVLFLVLNLILGNHYSFSRIAFSMIGWQSLGNSNWYIFDMLVLYLLCFLSFLVIKRNNSRGIQFLGVFILTLLSVLFIYVLQKLGQARLWYNTLILFSAGFWYSFFKEPIEKVLMRNDLLFSLGVAIVIVIYAVSYFHRWDRLVFYTIWGVCFTALVLLFTMKVSVNSVILNWFGEHVFSVYIIQRIPFIIFSKIAFFIQHKYLFLIVSYAFTIPLAIMLDFVIDKIDKLIWKKKTVFSGNEIAIN